MALKHLKTSATPSVSAPEEHHSINSAAVPVGQELLTSAENTQSCFMFSFMEGGGAGVRRSSVRSQLFYEAVRRVE